MRILLTGGGTGGHLYPLVAVTRALKQIAEKEKITDFRLFFIGPNGNSKQVIQEEGVKAFTIRTGKIRRYWSLLNFVDLFKTLWSVLRVIWKLFWLYPDVIFSKGGYGSFPVVVACRLLRVPLIIHESDVTPNISNRFAKKFAKRIALSFAETKKYFPAGKIALTGNPIRREIIGGDKEVAATLFDLGGVKPVILILGGSQGSERINEIIIQSLKRLVKIAEIIHQTGELNFKDVRAEGMVELHDLEENEQKRWHPYSFLDEDKMASALLVSDLIISRAGGGGIFEIAASAKPSILVPLGGAAQEHQRANAYAYARTGAATVIEETNLTPNLLLVEIEKILNNAERSQEMSRKAKEFSRMDAAETIAREIINVAYTHK